MQRRVPLPHARAMLALVFAVVFLTPAIAAAHPDTTGDPAHDNALPHLGSGGAVLNPTQLLEEHDERTEDTLATGHTSSGEITDLEVVGRGDRLVPDATTDVWAHDGYAYLGTFNVPCGTGENYVEGTGPVVLVDDVEQPGIPVFDVHDVHNPTYVGNIPSVEGSRINDVKVASLNSGDILVHSNEACAGGPGGFEIYDVQDPTRPVHLARVQTGDINALLRTQFGLTDAGVHNLYLFTRDGRDYVAVQVEGLFGNFQIFDITVPTAPALVGAWGAEQLLDSSVDWANTTDIDVIMEAQAYLLDGFGASQNRFLHDFWVSEAGTLAYLANWDAGLVRLDLTDLSDPQVVAVAIDPTSEDGEVNSHSVWPNAAGNVVVEGEEDFAPFKLQLFINEGLIGIFDAAEATFTPNIADLPERRFSGTAVYIGLACDPDTVPAAGADGQVAVAMRGACFFSDKVANAEAAGYDAVIIFNSEGNEGLLSPSPGTPGLELDTPTIFVGHSTGLALFGVDAASELTIGQTGESARGSAEPDGWSGFRIWDWSDPANPILASTFNTVCSADPVDPSCDPRGTYSSHNVIVEGNLAYFSWYSDGVIVIDVSDPYRPVEVARYNPTGPAFEAENGGIQDVWGIFKEENRPWIYASDRNGGLYILQLVGKAAAIQAGQTVEVAVGRALGQLGQGITAALAGIDDRAALEPFGRAVATAVEEYRNAVDAAVSEFQARIRDGAQGDAVRNELINALDSARARLLNRLHEAKDQLNVNLHQSGVEAEQRDEFNNRFNRTVDQLGNTLESVKNQFIQDFNRLRG